MSKLFYVETFNDEGKVTSCVNYEVDSLTKLIVNEKEFGEIIRNPEIYTLHNKDDLKKITFAALLKVSDAIQNRCSPEEMPGLVFSLNSLVQRLLDF